MEQGFFLAKELNIGWGDVEAMSSRDRIWLFNRLGQWFDDRRAEDEKESQNATTGMNVKSFT